VAKSKTTKALKDSTATAAAPRKKQGDGFRAIEGNLQDCFCLISCAVAVLDRAEDESEMDGEKAAQALSVLRRGIEDFNKVQQDLDEWHLRHGGPQP
jgi:hypothetical protein